MIIYIHIPKCGGTTINHILRNNFRDDSRFYVNPSDITASRSKFAGLSDKEKKSLSLLHGHLSYGWHKLIPQEAMYFTIIREPVERVVSQYNYVRFRTDHSHYLREVVEEENMSIAEYVTSGVCDEVNNGMTRLLAGVEDIIQEPFGDSSIPYGTNDPALLESALENIDNHFAAVGLTEHFDKSLLLFRNFFDLKNVGYIRKNIGSRHYKKVQPDSEDLEAIRQYNQLDRKLYDEVRSRFREAIDSLTLPGAQTTWLKIRSQSREYYRKARMRFSTATQAIHPNN